MGYQGFLNKKKRDRSSALNSYLNMTGERDINLQPDDDLFTDLMFSHIGVGNFIYTIHEDLYALELTGINPDDFYGSKSQWNSRLINSLSRSGDGSNGLYPGGIEDEDINTGSPYWNIAFQPENPNGGIRAPLNAIQGMEETDSDAIDKYVYQYYVSLQEDLRVDNDDSAYYNHEDSSPHFYEEGEAMANVDQVAEPPYQIDPQTLEQVFLEEGVHFEIQTFERYRVIESWYVDRLNELGAYWQTHIPTSQSIVQDAFNQDLGVHPLAEFIDGIDGTGKLGEYESLLENIYQTLSSIQNDVEDEKERVEEIIDGTYQGTDYDWPDELPEQKGDAPPEHLTWQGVEDYFDMWAINVHNAYAGIRYDYESLDPFNIDASWYNEEDNSLLRWARFAIAARIERPTGTLVSIRSLQTAISQQINAISKHTNALQEAGVDPEEYLQKPRLMAAFYMEERDADDELTATTANLLISAPAHVTRIDVYRAESFVTEYLSNPLVVEGQWENVYTEITDRKDDTTQAIQVQWKEEIPPEDRGTFLWYRVRVFDDGTPLDDSSVVPYPTYSEMSDHLHEEDGLQVTSQGIREIPGIGKATRITLPDEAEELNIRRGSYVMVQGYNSIFQVVKAAQDTIYIYPSVATHTTHLIYLPIGLMNAYQV